MSASPGRLWGWLPAASILVALAAVPFWNRSPGLPDQAYLGRAAVALLVVAAASQWRALAATRQHLRPDAAIVAILAVLALSAWAVSRAVAVGCIRCSGSAAGLVEFSVAATLVMILATADPRVRQVAIPATLLPSLLAILTAGPAVLRFWHPSGELGDGRLSGVYGNPNLLGFIVACGVPVLFALDADGKAWRVARVVGVAVASAVILMTFSRSAILMAFVGTFVVLFGKARSRSAVLRTGLGCLMTGAALIASYPSFQSWREDVSFRSLRDAALAEDGSGWDRGRRGPISQGPSEIRIVDDLGRKALEVRADRANEGVSFEWGSLPRDRRYTLVVRVRSSGAPTVVQAALGDLAAGQKSAAVDVHLGGVPQEIRLDWNPANAPARARAYVFFPDGPGTIRVSAFLLEGSDPTAGGAVRLVAAAPMALKGPPGADQLRRRFADAEEDYAASRAEGLRLALRAIQSRPLLGIGWEQFPSYAERQSRYGLLATHNEYARFAAELGVPGFLLLVTALTATALAARRHPKTLTSLAAVGLGVTSAVGLAFSNALVSPSLSLPLAVAVGWVCRRDQ